MKLYLLFKIPKILTCLDYRLFNVHLLYISGILSVIISLHIDYFIRIFNKKNCNIYT